MPRPSTAEIKENQVNLKQFVKNTTINASSFYGTSYAYAKMVERTSEICHILIIFCVLPEVISVLEDPQLPPES